MFNKKQFGHNFYGGSKMEFCESVTKENLARAFAAECQDGARYQFMAKEAEQNQMFYVSTLLKILAKNEMAHAKTFYNHILENLKSKNGNVNIEAGFPFKNSELNHSLKEASQIEEYEGNNIYTSFAKIAKDEGFINIAKTFEEVANVEKIHSQKLSQLHEMYTKKNFYKSATPKLYECSNCGHTEYRKEGWKNCPLCNYTQDYIIINLDQ